MAVFIDIPGVGTVEAKNAASEATLRELVRVMGGKTGGGGGGGRSVQLHRTRAGGWHRD